MEASTQHDNLRTKEQDKEMELNEPLLTTTNKIESDETTSTKQTMGAATASVVEAPTIIEVDPESLGNLSTSGSPGLSNNGVENLPEGWEERQTENGRSFYANHVRRTTQWHRPTHPASVTSNSNDSDKGNSDDQSCCTCGK